MNNISFESISDVDSEKAILGNLIMHPDNIYQIKDILDPLEFYRQEHRIVYTTLLSLSNRKMIINLKSIAKELERDGMIKRIGGAQLLTDIVYHAAKKDLTPYIRQMQLMSARRKMIELGEQMISAAADTTQNPDLGEWQARIASLAVSGAAEVDSFKDTLMAFITEIDRRKTLGSAGIMSGFPRLDVVLKGWQPTQLIILAARPSVGKTALALNFATNAVKAGKKVAFFSMEMSRYELISRVMACENTISMTHFVDTKELTDGEYSKVFQWANKMEKAGLYIFDECGGKPSEIMALSKMVQGKYGLDLVVVDYLQLLRPDRRNNNHAVEVGDISWSLKQMAMRLKVPVIALSQLNRAVEERQDKIPKLSDLRDSGNIEQDANVVIGLAQDDYDDKSAPVKRVTAVVLKNRNGPLATVQLQFYGAFMKFISAPTDATPIRASEVPA